MRMSDNVVDLFKGLSVFRKQLKQPLKDANNPFFKSKYVPLENVVEVIDDALKDTGLSYTQEIETTKNNTNIIHTIIIHESGQYMVVDGAELKPTKQDPQGIGSAITYNRRYSLSTAFGIASDTDDDGNQASSKPSNSSEGTKQQQQKAGAEHQRAIVEATIVKAQQQYSATNEQAAKWRQM
ncbi:phage replication protein, partial [Weissella oryzae SG25]